MASTAAPTARADAGMNPALKDALLAAFVTFVLLAPMLGMRTTSGPTGMTLEFHFEWVFLFTAIVFAVANACVPRDSGNPAAATRTKKMGKTAVSTTAWSEETAQSYIAQARSSFRPRPSRSSHVDFAIVASLTRPTPE